MAGKAYLRDLVAKPEFVQRLSQAFSDLRADFELDLDTTKEKIDALLAQHVNAKDHLDHLSSISKNSSGVLQGLRGTGKTHLMLLARHRINAKLLSERNLCIYVNMKRLSVPPDLNEDTFNRVFAVYLYECVVAQLGIELKSQSPHGILATVKLFLDGERRRFIQKMASAVRTLSDSAAGWLRGSTSVEAIGAYTHKVVAQRGEIEKIVASFAGEIGVSGAALKSGISSEISESSQNESEVGENSLRYFDVSQVHRALKRLVSDLELNSIVFFVDEWEKVYDRKDIQRWAAELINKIIDDPIYFWIAYVPYRGDLKPLAIGGDLQHLINLDSDLIIENSKADRIACIEYFKDFIDKRLLSQFPAGDIKVGTLVNDNRKLESMVLASMGNQRDFGTILLGAWQNYKAYRQGALKQGKPFQYINDQHIRDAIRMDGQKKKENILNDGGATQVWNKVIDFLTAKNSSHFAVMETKEQKDALQEHEFSELIYHRLMNVRKLGVEPKDVGASSKLMILAASYSATQEMHAKQITYVKDNSVVDSRVRRYIFDAASVIRELRITDGAIHPCRSCNAGIDAGKMKAAWDRNSCPFCGNEIYLKS
jgi:hypothetical protein